MSQTPYAAFRAEPDALGRLDYFCNKDPKCPHCGTEVNVGDNELWKLYEEGEHDISCPNCDLDFTVTTSVTYSFSTDDVEQS